MGLNTSHGAWDGGYSSFHYWRKEIARLAGLPPLELMEGFYRPLIKDGYAPSTLYYGEDTYTGFKWSIHEIDKLLPIKWGSLKPSPLHKLLYHSDCDGHLRWSSCRKIADELEKLLPLMKDEDAGGHIGKWKDKTQTFIDGLRLAYSRKENLRFG